MISDANLDHKIYQGPQIMFPALAIHGGPKVRTEKFPSRMSMGGNERRMIEELFACYDDLGQDPGYQGIFEDRYCELFTRMMGGGYADVVSSGTVSLYIAIKALQIPKGRHVLISPITDPGCFSAIIDNDLVPKLVDARGVGYNISFAAIRARVDEEVAAIVLVHALGTSVEDMEGIAAYCRARGIALIEDCSQAHGGPIQRQTGR